MVSKNINTKFSMSLALLFGAFLAMPTTSFAQSPGQLIREHAENLRCAADDMRDEIKDHFRCSRNYGKMLGTTAQIKGRAAAVARRIKRNPCYKTLDRDLKKLDELTCELNSLYEEALFRASRCLDKPIKCDTRHVAAKIGAMVEMSRCMTLASRSHGVVVNSHRELPVYQPRVEIPVIEPVYPRPSHAVYPELIAPGHSRPSHRINSGHGHSVLNR